MTRRAKKTYAHTLTEITYPPTPTPPPRQTKLYLGHPTTPSSHGNISESAQVVALLSYFFLMQSMY